MTISCRIIVYHCHWFVLRNVEEEEEKCAEPVKSLFALIPVVHGQMVLSIAVLQEQPWIFVIL